MTITWKEIFTLIMELFEIEHQSEIAISLDVHRSTISRIMSGEKKRLILKNSDLYDKIFNPKNENSPAYKHCSKHKEDEKGLLSSVKLKIAELGFSEAVNDRDNLSYKDYIMGLLRQAKDNQPTKNTIKKEFYYLSDDDELSDLRFELEPPARIFNNDESKLRAFAIQNNNNFRKLKARGWDFNKPETWTGVVWSNSKSNKRVTSINFEEYVLVGVLDLSNFAYMTDLLIKNNSFTSLNITGCNSLTRLNCERNFLTELDVSDNTLLKELYLHKNKVNRLDVTKNIFLEWLGFDSNRITAIDVSKNPELVYLSCGDNSLNELDLSNNTHLYQLWCYGNNLTMLDVSKQKELEVLGAFENLLTELDLSDNPLLKDVLIYSNRLTSISTLKDLKELFKVDILNNPLDLNDPEQAHAIEEIKATVKTNSFNRPLLNARTFGSGFDY